MSMRYPGGLIATSPVNARYPSGVWTQAQAAPYQAQNVWTRDRFWPNTTLLLQGDGATNGAQNNTFLDSSSNNFTITRNGNTTQGSFTPYEQDGYWSNYFAGSQSLSNGTNVTASGDFTLECWVNLSSYSAARIFFAVGNETANRRAFFIDSSGVIKIDLASVGATSLGGSVPINTWTHIAITRSSNTVTAYVNGVATGTTATISGTFGNGNGFYIGSVSDNSNSMVGYISNLRWVLGSVVYTAAFTPPVTPLTAVTNTSILSCQSNRFRDNSANAYALTVNGSPSVQSFQPFPGATTWSASVLGGSGYFDGSGDYIQAGTNANLALGSGNFTIEGWHYCTGYNGGGTLYSTINTYPSSTGLLFYIDSIGRYTIDVNGTILQPAGTAALNTWVHWAVVRNGSTLSIYINGTSVGSVSSSTNFTDQYAVIGRTGAGTNSNLFLGYLSNTRMVKGTAVYTANFTPPTAPVTAISNTQFLCDFTNAGIYDNSMMNNLETVGNAQVSTSVVKYGTGSMAFDGNGDWLNMLTTPNITFGSGDFTLEGWLYLNSVSGDQIIFDQRPATTQGAYPVLYMSNAVMTWYISTSPRIQSSSLSTGVWYHFAVSRSGSSTRMFINGNQTGSTYTDTNNYLASRSVIGISAYDLAGGFLNGYIDDLRITKGAARYIGNFTPPIARLPAQ